MDSDRLERSNLWSHFVKMITPGKLNPGDTVAAISLSWGGPGAFPHRYKAGKEQFIKAFGVNVVETTNALRDPAWLAQNPEARADDLMEAFAEPRIKGIVSTIGGDESIRILPYVDLEIIAANPKIVLGYSDTTVTHLACYKAGLRSFYGPSFMSGFAENGGMFPYMESAVRRSLFTAEPIGVVAPNTEGWTVERLDWADPANQQRTRRLRQDGEWRFLSGTGVAEGRLIGGCLEVLSWLRGTLVWPNDEAFDGAMLFIETSEEAPSPEFVKRELRTYAAMGVLRRLTGILFGRPGGDVPPERFAEYDDAILQVVREEEGLDQMAIVTRMDFGHTDPMFVLPYGVRARIDCDRRQFSILERGVVE
jgi:muramoyltetrapeptide carboxypeptidase LdcA involved in peptidoglycan recycling